MQFVVYRFLAVCLAIPFVGGIASAAETPAQAGGLAAGQTMPFHVVQFMNTEHRDSSGCPSVMISNANTRGIVIWTRGPLDAAFRLAGALETGPADRKKFPCFLVGFDAEPEILTEKSANLRKVIVGKPRSSAVKEWNGRGIDPSARVLVFLLEKKMIKSQWTFTDDGPDAEAVKAIVAAARSAAEPTANRPPKPGS